MEVLKLTENKESKNRKKEKKQGGIIQFSSFVWRTAKLRPTPSKD